MRCEKRRVGSDKSIFFINVSFFSLLYFVKQNKNNMIGEGKSEL